MAARYGCTTDTLPTEVENDPPEKISAGPPSSGKVTSGNELP